MDEAKKREELERHRGVHLMFTHTSTEAETNKQTHKDTHTPSYRTSHEINKWCTPRCVCVYFCIIPFYDEKFKLDRFARVKYLNVEENVVFCVSLSHSHHSHHRNL